MARQDRLYQFARAALSVVTEAWPTDPDDALPLPTRQYVGVGLIAWDCEQFTVSAMRTFGIDGDVAAEQMVSAGALIATRAMALDFSIVRCTPTAEINGDELEVPSEEAIEASAMWTLVDAETLKTILAEAQRQGNLAAFQGNGLAFESWNAVGPEGGLLAGTLRVRLATV